MQTISTIVDIAMSVFQVHGVDAAGQAVARRQLKRRQVLALFAKLPPCLIGIEACASSHYWARELRALGHTVRLMPPAYVKPYVKRGRNRARLQYQREARQSRSARRIVGGRAPQPAKVNATMIGPSTVNTTLAMA
jgi:transposase